MNEALDPRKEQVRRQFGQHAAGYVTSANHAAGVDLAYMAANAPVCPDARLLDVATGAGHVANAFAPLVGQVTACDLTPEMLDTAKQFIAANGRTNVEFVAADAEHLPFPAEAYDIVTCRIAAHHFTDVPAFASEAHRVLKRGGSLLLIDNVAPERDGLDWFYNDIEKQRDPSHVRAWKKSEWIRMLETAGFAVEAMIRFPKTFVFADWCRRAGVPETERISLEMKLLRAPADVQRHFAVEIDDAERLLSFSGESVYVHAVKS
ncbi:SAM-dependent methyltransferase [Gordoniibacillus kamchatkensis]|uniref:SAM-dependent methyltransferase n=1 Tax=Gordoniibacillus kamchatkensis TaxID=1590651 RepID=A0ABR5ADJ2_9BACL|nr:methyltransferase domain-containing protein [Paenibacillus sp. VKM B-2647]KIL39088.1 SAM-dependent methyltransferase [Paenibacillus sp. VKM B-2647]